MLVSFASRRQDHKRVDLTARLARGGHDLEPLDDVPLAPIVMRCSPSMPSGATMVAVHGSTARMVRSLTETPKSPTYSPGQTRMVSPGLLALMACWTVA